jgi:transmembrane sensor
MTERQGSLLSALPSDPVGMAEMWALRTETGAMDDRAWQEFDAWIRADPAHQQAFERVQAWFGKIDSAVASPDFWAKPRRALPVPIRSWESWSFPLAAGLCGAIFLSALAWSVLRPANHDTSTSAAFQTADRGMSLKLPDQSEVVLNSHSSLIQRYTATRRSVALGAGSEADFDVRHDVARPFEITAGRTHIQVLGTAFDVKFLSDLTRVSVSRGIVRVSDEAGTRSETLTVGQSLAIDASTGRWTTGKVADAAPWRYGHLVYNHQPLSEVCADIARATNRPVDVSPNARQLLFTGVLKISKPELMAQTLALYLPIKSSVFGGRIEVTRRDTAGPN